MPEAGIERVITVDKRYNIMAELENKKPVENLKGEKPIVFVEGDEDRVVIEKGEYDTSLFSQQYTTAFGILKQLIEASEDECYPGQGSSRIIAFCGDRGAGKTSCMMSVRYAIAHSEEEEISAYLRNNGLRKADLNFDILNPIDPSFFDESHKKWHKDARDDKQAEAHG